MSLEERLAFYGAYHRHPMNKLIHLICVPTLWLASCIWLCDTGPLLPMDYYERIPVLSTYLVPDGALVTLLFYVVFYAYLDAVGCWPANLLLTVLCYTAQKIHAVALTSTWPPHWWWFLPDFFLASCKKLVVFNLAWSNAGCSPGFSVSCAHCECNSRALTCVEVASVVVAIVVLFIRSSSHPFLRIRKGGVAWYYFYVMMTTLTSTPTTFLFLLTTQAVSRHGKLHLLR